MSSIVTIIEEFNNVVIDDCRGDISVSETSFYSEFVGDKYAKEAEASAIAAAQSEANAAQSETNAATSEANAAQSEANALTQANRSESEADRAEAEADRAQGYADSIDPEGLKFPQTADFEARREMRKREYAGSGTQNTPLTINGDDASIDYPETDSDVAVMSEHIEIVDGVEVTIPDGTEVKYPPASDGTKVINTSTGEVKKFTSVAGVGEHTECYTVDFDGSTYVEIPQVQMEAGAKVSFKFKWDNAGDTLTEKLLDGDTPNRAYVMVATNQDNRLWFTGFSDATLNGTPVSDNEVKIEAGVEHIFEATLSAETSFSAIGAHYTGIDNWTGQIWDVKLEDPTQAIPVRRYLTAQFQDADLPAPIDDEVKDITPFSGDVGWMADYNNDGYAVCPTFPLADRMVVACDFIPTDTHDMWWGDATVGNAIAYKSTAADFTVIVGSSDFVFPALKVGHSHVAIIDVTANGDGTYTVSVDVNQDNVTATDVVFGGTEFSAFGLGGKGDGNNPELRFTGILNKCSITYPDTPDMNLNWRGIEDTDPADRGTILDVNGFGDEDWTPEFGAIKGRAIDLPEWEVPSANEVSFVFNHNITSQRQHVLSGRNRQGGTINVFRVENSIIDTGALSLHVDGVLAKAGDSLTEGVHHIRMVLPTTSYQSVNWVGNYGLGSSHGLSGEVWNLHLTDIDNPSNSRHYPLVINSATQPADDAPIVDEAYDKDTAPFYSPDYGDGEDNNRGIDIPKWDAPLGGAGSFKFKCIAEDNTGRSSAYVFDNEGLDGARSYVHNSGSNPNTWNYVGVYGFKVNGVDTPALTDIPLGVELEVEGTFVDGGGVEVFGSRFNKGTGNNWQGRIWDIELIDNTDPTNSRFYPGIEYRPDGDTSGTVLEEVLKPELVVNGTFDTDLSGWDVHEGADNTVSWDAGTCRIQSPTGAYCGIVQEDLLTIGETYEVTTTCVRNSGALVYDMGTFQDKVAEGTSTVTFVADATQVAFKRAGSGVDCTLDNISVKRVTDGTLVNFPAGSEWTLAQLDDLTEATPVGFTGPVWNNDLPNTDAVMNGFTNEWHYVDSTTDGTIVGNTTWIPHTIQDSQKAFLYADVTDGADVIISRKDLTFLETWTEDLALHDVVCPYGSVQFGGTSHDGVPLSIGLVAQGYSAFGEWDTATQGRMAKWSTMSDSQKRVWSENPKNNIRYDSERGAFLQDKYRIRTVEGLGDNWTDCLPTQENNINKFVTEGYHIGRRGPSVEGSDDYRNSGNLSITFRTTASNFGMNLNGFMSTKWASEITDSEAVKAIPIALTQRLNQGAWDKTYNPTGTAVFSDGNKWYNTTDYVASAEDCFALATGGSISSGQSGADSQYDYFDAIYAGQVGDLRLNANKQNKQELLADAVRRGVGGETRGKGKVPFTRFSGTTFANVGNTTTAYIIDEDGMDKPNIGDIVVFTQDAWVTALWGVVDSNGSNWYSVTKHVDSPDFPAMVSGNPVTTMRHEMLPASYDSLPWQAIYGGPADIASAHPGGVIGRWEPTIGELSVKAEQIHKAVVGDGSSWATPSFTHDPVANTVSITGGVVSPNVALVSVEAWADFTEADSIIDPETTDSMIVATDDYQVDKGNRLRPSLTGVISTGSGSERNIITRENDDSVEYMTPSITGAEAHARLVEKDGLLYVQWIGKENDGLDLIDDADIVHTEMIPVGIYNKNEGL